MRAIFIQARMGSSRLPGKVMINMAGRPMLGLLIDRLRYCKNVDRIVVSTSHQPADDVIEDYCVENNVFCYRGSENNALDRFYQTNKQVEADVIGRITGDCPLIDPAEVDKFFAEAKGAGGAYDYVWCGDPPAYASGMCGEVFTAEALSKAWHNARDDFDREHITPYIRSEEGGFSMKSMGNPEDKPDYRLTVDTADDYALVKRVAAHFLPHKVDFTQQEIFDLLKDNPAWVELNAEVTQLTGPHVR